LQKCLLMEALCAFVGRLLMGGRSYRLTRAFPCQILHIWSSSAGWA
jgi:hypothetical protein